MINDYNNNKFLLFNFKNTIILLKNIFFLQLTRLIKNI